MNFDDLLTPADREFVFFFPYPLDETMTKEKDIELAEIKAAIDKYKKFECNQIKKILLYYLKFIIANEGTPIAIDIINRLFFDSPTLDSVKPMAGMLAGFAVMSVQLYRDNYYSNYDVKIRRISRPKLLKLHRRWVRAGKAPTDAGKPKLVIY